MSETNTNQDFENEVRRIARAKWPDAQYSGATMLDGKERDGVFETEESVNFIEATVSAGAGKAKEDTKKLFKAIVEHNKTGSLKAGIGWFVTKNEPTADQRKEVNEHGKGQVRAVSFNQFQQSLVDVRGYLSSRKNHFFGSVQDFTEPNKNPSIPFVEIGLTNPYTGESFLVSNIVDMLLNTKHIAITGQYGAGKSMTLREIFGRLEEKYIKTQTSKFPLYINLREHSGQKDPVEILERHARNIGFESPSSIIRAWRAGFCILLIDGFDEVATFGVQGSWKKLKDLRTRSLEGVRRLIRESAEAGVIVAGRSHYFEDEKELCAALSLQNAHNLALDEFTHDQVRTFLNRFPGASKEHSLPDWLPTRPLLLGYLASKGLLTQLTDRNENLDVVNGWDYLLSRIYEREQNIETNLDAATLRRILERAATLARVSEDGLGPISRREMFSVFSEVCGYEPDEQGVLAIQRLPGLGIYKADDESRCFIDKELAEVCSGNELLNFIKNPYDAAKDTLWVDAMNSCDRPIGNIGAELVIKRMENGTDLRGHISQAVSFLNSRQDLECVRGDVSVILCQSSIDLETPLSVAGMNYEGTTLNITNESGNLKYLTFSNCLFEEVSIHARDNNEKIPYFDECLIEKVSGRFSKDDLPSGKFSNNCEILNFDFASTSEAIRSTQMSAAEKVMLVTLRKLFVQSISGRAESALFRGLDLDERRYVPDILKILSKHGVTVQLSKGDGIVWLPSRKSIGRVRRIISAPSECNDEIVKEVRSIA